MWISRKRVVTSLCYIEQCLLSAPNELRERSLLPSLLFLLFLFLSPSFTSPVPVQLPTSLPALLPCAAKQEPNLLPILLKIEQNFTFSLR